MTINTQKLRERIDAAIRRITSGSAPMRVPADHTDPDLVLADAKIALNAQAAEIARLREALSSIRQYGNDTLSGRADGGPDDRKWQREAVIEMRNRARAALAQEGS